MLLLPATSQTAWVLAEVSLEEESNPRSAHRDAEDERTLKQIFLGSFNKEDFLN